MIDFEKNKTLTEREPNHDNKLDELSKSSLNQFNSKINQILKRNPSLDEKQFDVIKSSDLKIKIDSIRNEIHDSLRKDKETSFNKKSINDSLNTSLMKNAVFLTKNRNSEKIKNQLQKKQLKNASLDFNQNN